MKRFVFFEFVYFVPEFIYFVLTYVLYMYISSLLLSSENMCGTRLLNGVLNEIWTHSCVQYKMFSDESNKLETYIYITRMWEQNK